MNKEERAEEKLRTWCWYACAACGKYNDGAAVKACSDYALKHSGGRGGGCVYVAGGQDRPKSPWH